MAFTGNAGNFECFETKILCFFTVFTTFWRVLEQFIAKESLLARCPDKLVGAIYTWDRKVLEFAANIDNLGLGFPNFLKIAFRHNQRSVQIDVTSAMRDYV